MQRITILSLMMCMGALLQALAYPTQGNTPESIPAGYESACAFADKLSTVELKFADDYPDQLTEAERFLLFGCDPSRSTDPHRGVATYLMQTLSNYMDKTGQLPAAISDEVVETAWEDCAPGVVAFEKEILRSPITGRYPRLDAQNFSRGDMFVKVLSESQIREMAEVDGNLKSLLEKKTPGNPNQKGQLLTKVFYFRFYGENEIVFTGLHYAYN